MAKVKSKQSTAVDRAAEAVGTVLGSIAGTLESLHEQHPHPVEDARDALAAGQEKVAAVVRRTKKAATQARRKGTRSATRVKRAARKVVKRTKRAITRGRKIAKHLKGRLKKR